MGSIGRAFLRGRYGSAAWTPATPAGLVAWYDFSRTGNMWADTAGTVASTNGAKFARIDDLSGSANHATQATAGNQPTRTDAGVNGKTVGTFASASTTHLDSPAFTIAQPCSMLVWFSGAAATGYVCDSQSNARGLLIITTTPNIYAGTALAAGSAVNTLQHFVAGLFNGASSIIRLDATETSGAAGVNVATTGITIGAAGGATTYFDGKICEIAYYTGDIGITHRNSAQSYGTAKWGTP